MLRTLKKHQSSRLWFLSAIFSIGIVSLSIQTLHSEGIKSAKLESDIIKEHYEQTKPKFSRGDVRSHASAETGIWVTYQSGVYGKLHGLIHRCDRVC